MLVSFTPLNVCRSLPFSFRSNPTLENDYYLFLAFFVLPQIFPQHLAKLKIIEKSYKPKFLFSRNNGQAYKNRQTTPTEWIRTLFQKLMRKYCCGGQERIFMCLPYLRSAVIWLHQMLFLSTSLVSGASSSYYKPHASLSDPGFRCWAEWKPDGPDR